MAPGRIRKMKPLKRRPRYGHRHKLRTNRIGRIPSLTHMFKREGAVVRVVNRSSNAEHPTWPSLSTFATGWGLGSVSGDTFDGTYQFGVSAAFKLTDVISPQDFTDLFDRYKIVKVALKIMYQSNISNAHAASNLLPIINYSFDADDANVPPSLESVTTKGYVKNKILNANRPFSWVCKPRVDKVVYNNGVTTAFSSEKACWLDCTSNAVEHFAFKAWVNNFPMGAGDATINAQLTIQPIFYLAFKDSQ